eukprot:XP_001708826.1 Hypothetical protein GL50803_39492 [Giardia lamblia ATCC 50803]
MHSKRSRFRRVLLPVGYTCVGGGLLHCCDNVFKEICKIKVLEPNVVFDNIKSSSVLTKSFYLG